MAASAFVDYYAVLQVDQSVDQKGIKSSYYKLAKQHHPDRNINDPKATAKFQSVCYSIGYKAVLIISPTLR